MHYSVGIDVKNDPNTFLIQVHFNEPLSRGMSATPFCQTTITSPSLRLKDLRLTFLQAVWFLRKFYDLHREADGISLSGSSTPRSSPSLPPPSPRASFSLGSDSGASTARNSRNSLATLNRRSSHTRQESTTPVQRARANSVAPRTAPSPLSFRASRPQGLNVPDHPAPAGLQRNRIGSLQEGPSSPTHPGTLSHLNPRSATLQARLPGKSDGLMHLSPNGRQGGSATRSAVTLSHMAKTATTNNPGTANKMPERRPNRSMSVVGRR